MATNEKKIRMGMFGERTKRTEIRRTRNRPGLKLSAQNLIFLLVGLAGILIIISFSPRGSHDLQIDSYQQYHDPPILKDRQENDNPVVTTQNLGDTSTTTTKDGPTWHLDLEGKPIKVAYAISLIECTDRHKSGQSSIAGLQDASIVMRHSIHQNSVRNPESGSRYDYEMYAIIHEQARACAPVLEDAGFTILIRDQPVQESEIQGEYLRKNIRKEVCCGAAEFVKLYALTIPGTPLVVHLDIDFIFRTPMDEIFDVMLGATDEGTRSKIEREIPSAPWPVNIEATFTRDYTSGVPGRNTGFQAGFWIVKPSQKHFDNLLAIIREGDYKEGFGRDNGWYSLGYGGFVGARAMQGLMAYYYDIRAPGTWLELNNCRFNAVQAIVKKRGLCVNNQTSCEDCTMTNIEDIHSFHYTACRKPWTCISTSTKDPSNTYSRANSMPVDIINLEKCLASRKVWHEYRLDLESKLYALTKDESVLAGQSGEYKKEHFLGHCKEDQSQGYIRLGGSPETMKRIPELYL